MHITIEVDGLPQPGGSKKVVPLKALIERVGRRWKGMRGSRGGAFWVNQDDIMSVVRVIDDNPKAKKWKERVEKAAIKQLGIHANPEKRLLLAEPLIVTTQFFMPRPKGHFKKDGSLSAEGKRRPYPTVKPDALKLLRSTEDALTGVVWSDDAVIVDHFLHKRYADSDEQVGAIVHVFPVSQYRYEIKFTRAG